MAPERSTTRKIGEKGLIGREDFNAFRNRKCPGFLGVDRSAPIIAAFVEIGARIRIDDGEKSYHHRRWRWTDTQFDNRKARNVVTASDHRQTIFVSAFPNSAWK